jgi:hypothetical protein
MTTHITKRKIEKCIGKHICDADWDGFCAIHLMEVASCFLDCKPHDTVRVAVTKEEVECILAYHVDDEVWERFIADDNQRDQMERGLIDDFTHIALIELKKQMEAEGGGTGIHNDAERM